jgi:hypothetical protein
VVVLWPSPSGPAFFSAVESPGGVLREDAAGFSGDLHVRASLLDCQCLEFVHHAGALSATLAVVTTLSAATAAARVTSCRLHLLA